VLVSWGKSKLQIQWDLVWQYQAFVTAGIKPDRESQRWELHRLFLCECASSWWGVRRPLGSLFAVLNLTGPVWKMSKLVDTVWCDFCVCKSGECRRGNSHSPLPAKALWLDHDEFSINIDLQNENSSNYVCKQNVQQRTQEGPDDSNLYSILNFRKESSLSEVSTKYGRRKRRKCDKGWLLVQLRNSFMVKMVLEHFFFPFLIRIFTNGNSHNRCNFPFFKEVLYFLLGR
jgi:hypothetical protein